MKIKREHIFRFTFFIGVFLYLILPKLKSTFPGSVAGLYAQITQQIINNGFKPPLYIDYYGSAAVPFAYPPLSFYLFAIFSYFFHIDKWIYLLYFPSIFLLCSTALVFSIASKLTKNKIIPYVTSAFFVSSPGILSYHSGGDGICRGLALMFALASIIYSIEVSRNNTKKNILLLGSFLGLTLLTHGSYFVFGLFVSIVIILFSEKPLREKTKNIFKISSLIFIISLPWWIYIYKNFGIGVIINALHTHGNLTGPSYFSNFSNLKSLLYQTIIGTNENILLISSSIFGVYLNILNNKYLLPFLLLISLPIVGFEGQRFIFLLLLFNSISAFELLINKTESSNIISKVVVILTTILFLLMPLESNLRSQISKSFIKQTDLETLKETINGSDYIYFSSSIIKQEWFPFLLQARSSISPFGAEWNGRYNTQLIRFQELLNCSKDVSENCLDKMIYDDNQYRPKYIIFENDFRYKDKTSIRIGQYNVYEIR